MKRSLSGRDRLALLLISGFALPGLRSAWADESLQVSGHVVIPQGHAEKCTQRSGCLCDFAVRQVAQRCRVSESRDRVEATDSFDSHPEKSWIVDAGSRTSACGVRLRCEFVPLVERCQFVMPDGGAGPPCATDL